MEKKEKVKGYIIYKNTLKGLMDVSNNTPAYNKTLCEYTVERDDFTKEQIEIQNKKRWYAETNEDIKIYNDLDKIIEKIMYEKIFNGQTEKILDSIYNEIMDSEIRIIAYFKDNTKSKSLNITYETDYVKEPFIENLEFEYSYDMKEFNEQLKDIYHISSFTTDDEKVWLEKVNVTIYTYKYNEIDKKVKKLINKLIRNKLTYCIKNGNFIVPKEYVDKGIEGIEEWRNIKSSNNKNNSIEKKLIKDVVKERKRYAYDAVWNAMNKIARAGNNFDWTVPRLMIDGQYNKQRTQKLATKILGTKDKQKLIEMSEQEITNRAKSYWKTKLMEAYNEVDKLEV